MIDHARRELAVWEQQLHMIVKASAPSLCAEQAAQVQFPTLYCVSKVFEPLYRVDCIKHS